MDYGQEHALLKLNRSIMIKVLNLTRQLFVVYRQQKCNMAQDLQPITDTVFLPLLFIMEIPLIHGNFCLNVDSKVFKAIRRSVNINGDIFLNYLTISENEEGDEQTAASNNKISIILCL